MRSMTGFGKAEGRYEDSLSFTVEISSVNRKQLEVLEVTPLDRILIETDSPYLTPEPFRGKRNDSAKLQYVAAKIGEVKGISMEETAAVTMENGRRLFRI